MFLCEWFSVNELCKCAVVLIFKGNLHESHLLSFRLRVSLWWMQAILVSSSQDLWCKWAWLFGSKNRSLDFLLSNILWQYDFRCFLKLSQFTHYLYLWQTKNTEGQWFKYIWDLFNKKHAKCLKPVLYSTFWSLCQTLSRLSTRVDKLHQRAVLWKISHDMLSMYVLYLENYHMQ